MRRAVVVVVLALLGTGLAKADTSSGSITGTVTDGNGAALVNVCVNASQVDSDGWGSDITREDGTYEIDLVPAGFYKIQFVDCNGNDSVYAGEWYNDKPSFETADTVEVTAGGTTSGIDASLAKGGEIEGTVTNTNGDPVYACIGLFDQSDNGYWFNSDGTDGHWHAGGLQSGTYKVRFDDCHYPPDHATVWYDGKQSQGDATPVSVTLGEVTTGIDAIMPPVSHITGTVTDTEGVTLGGVCVNAYDTSFDWLASATTDTDGTYSVAVPSGDYKIDFQDCSDGTLVEQWFRGKPDFESADIVSVGTGETTSGVDAAMDGGGSSAAYDIALADLSVENVPLRTDNGPLASPGYLRKVHVTIENDGTEMPTADPEIYISACTVTDHRCTVVADEPLTSPRPGKSRDASYTWNGIGMVGDVTISAYVLASPDDDASNDYRSIDHYVLVGGSGFGVTL
ncbi:MAG: carboxypeptidase-like regulatory domain-containing protein [Actinomycetota bacterium]